MTLAYPVVTSTGFPSIPGSVKPFAFFPTQAFAELGPALEWLGVQVSFADVVSARRAELSGVQPLVAQLRSVLAASGPRSSVEDVARQLSLSSRTLQRRLEELGTSFQKELLTHRLRAAQVALRETDQAITSISFEAGFSTPQHFSAAFRKFTGLTPTHGVDIARAFADHKARLVLQTTSATDPETTALVAMLAETAHEIKLFDAPITTAVGAQRLAQTGTATFGGLDTVINLVQVQQSEMATLSSLEDIETFIAGKLRAALLITQIAANRMRVSLTEGLILNIVAMPEPVSGGASLIAGMLRSALADMTRTEAQTWAGNGIRINAIGPRVVMPGDKPTAALASEPEMAAVALYLASRRARGLSGHIFDAQGSLTTCA